MWCFDHGLEAEPAFDPVRLSFLISYAMVLAGVYPPARDELHRRCLAAESRILAGADDVETAREFGAISRELSDAGRILRVFDELLRSRARSPAMAKLLPFAVPPLVEARRYEDVLKAVPNIESVVADRIEEAEAQLQYLQSEPATDPLLPELRETLKQGVVEEGGTYYEALLGTGNVDNANRCSESLISFHSTGWTYATLIGHAARTGAIGAARELARRGLQSLPETERAAVVAAAEGILRDAGD